jgi:hypothetical protein
VNPNGRTYGGPRETVDICENRSFLWFKWVKVHAAAGVYRDDTIDNILILANVNIKPPELRAAIRAYEYWTWDQ